MAKRLRLTDVIAGAALKEFHATILSGDISGLLSGNFVELSSDMYVAGQEGNLLLSPSVSSDGTLYNEGYFERVYSVEHPDIYTPGTNLKVMATNSTIIDSIQFGDFAFLLTNATMSGTSYSRESSLNTDHSTWYTEPHKIVTYVPGTSSSEIDLYVGNIDFNITEEDPDLIYGMLSGSTLVLYVKNLDGTP